MGTESMWGKLDPVPFVQPATVLREQAAALGEMTKNVLIGDVRKAQQGERLSFALDVVAKAVGGYRHRVVNIRHALLSPYPVELDVVSTGAQHICEDEAAFRHQLDEALHSEQVLAPLRMLLTLSTQGQ